MEQVENKTDDRPPIDIVAVNNKIKANLGRKGIPNRLVHQCNFPGCGVYTIHPKGYCCAEHYKEHKRMMKESGNARRS